MWSMVHGLYLRTCNKREPWCVGERKKSRRASGAAAWLTKAETTATTFPMQPVRDSGSRSTHFPLRMPALTSSAVSDSSMSSPVSASMKPGAWSAAAHMNAAPTAPSW